jgi:DUF4097 and DUF4098 domain-containing protein YvlB
MGLTGKLLLLLILPVMVEAGESVDERRTVSRDGFVEIHITRGEVGITGWDEDVVEVTGELDDLASGLTFEVRDGKTFIRVEMPRHNVNYGDGTDLDIRLPRTGSVEFEGVSTDVTLSGVMGGTGIRSVSGDIRARGLDKRIRIKSVSGEVDVTDANGKMKVSTVSGDLNLDVNASDITVDAVSGEVDLTLGDFDSLRVATVSGDQAIEGHLNNSGHMTMKSVSGEISLRFTDKVSARIDAKTGPGGDISNDMTADEPEDIFPAQMKLQTTLGDGSGSIIISTVTGDINLR